MGDESTMTGQDTDASTAGPYAEVHETHTGVVVLIGDHAYKVKKPVTTDFLDFSTIDRREQACAREVMLNRRLSPDSYLGVAYLTDPAGGRPEPVVVMRRYSDSSRLATILKRGTDTRPVLADIAAVLARFHEQAARGRAIDAQGETAAVTARWQENLSELTCFTPSILPAEQIHEAEHLAMRYIGGRADLFTHRIADRRILDGHGDLLADDIFCLPDGPALLDCLEFDDELRYVDAVDDAAFLAMDLEFLGRKDLAKFFLDRYSSIADDPAPPSLKDFYIAYRAVVRAKVDCVRFTQGRSDARLDASRHLAIALDHLRAGAVRVALIGGAPGTGKTTLAHALAERVGAQWISTDEVRRELQQANVIHGATGVLDAGLYAEDKVAAVYAEIIRRAHTQLAGGRSVILDATWRDPRYRDLARQLATRTESAILEMACTTPVKSATERIRTRPVGSSDATPQIAEELAAKGDLWENAHHIDTRNPVSQCSDEAEKLWRDTC